MDMTYKEVFKALSTTSSRNDKITILKQADLFTQEILEYAYNPFKHYYINKIAPTYEHLEPLIEIGAYKVGELLDDLASRKVSGDAARERVNNMLKRLDKEDAEIFTNILKKDMRCGISTKTINAAIPGLIPDFGAMLAKKWDDSRYQDGLLMSIKYDGVRAIYKDGKLLTRNGYELIGLNHILRHIPKDYSLDGELIIPGLHFQEASGYIRSDDPVLNAVYMVFDIPESTMPFDKRYRLYQDIVGIFDIPCIQGVKHIKVKNIDHMSRTFDKAIDAGYEGLMIKTPKHKYQTKRSWDWMKIKVENSEDLQVIGVFEGTGKYENQLGGLVVDYHGVAVKVGSGFSDVERINIWRGQEAFIGRVIEVKYHEITPDGSLRHPVYKGFRWDKD